VYVVSITPHVQFCVPAFAVDREAGTMETRPSFNNDNCETRPKPMFAVLAPSYIHIDLGRLVAAHTAKVGEARQMQNQVSHTFRHEEVQEMDSMANTRQAPLSHHSRHNALRHYLKLQVQFRLINHLIKQLSIHPPSYHPYSATEYWVYSKITMPQTNQRRNS
jgi:hypothetical protein